jgi:hypothetical protein
VAGSGESARGANDARRRHAPRASARAAAAAMSPASAVSRAASAAVSFTASSSTAASAELDSTCATHTPVMAPPAGSAGAVADAEPATSAAASTALPRARCTLASGKASITATPGDAAVASLDIMAGVRAARGPSEVKKWGRGRVAVCWLDQERREAKFFDKT